MSRKQKYYPETKFGGFTDIDGIVTFFSRVNSLLDLSHTVLDVGCGRGSHSEDPVPFRRDLRNLREKVAKVIGIDVDPCAEENPYIHEFRTLQGKTWPVDNETIDLIICDHVLEHIENPELFFKEAARVLKDQGYLCIRTPNRWSYIAIGATLIPNKFHSKVTSAIQESRKEEDVFPTLYKCNTTRKINKYMKNQGFDCLAYTYEAEPSYLSFSSIAYFFGVMHQMFAPSFLKPSIFAFGRLQRMKAGFQRLN